MAIINDIIQQNRQLSKRALKVFAKRKFEVKQKRRVETFGNDGISTGSTSTCASKS